MLEMSRSHFLVPKQVGGGVFFLHIPLSHEWTDI